MSYGIIFIDMLEKWMAIPILAVILLAGWLIPPRYYRWKFKKEEEEREQRRREESSEGNPGEVILADILNELREMRFELRLEIRGLGSTIWQAAIAVIVAVVGLIIAFM